MPRKAIKKPAKIIEDFIIEFIDAAPNISMFRNHTKYDRGKFHEFVSIEGKAIVRHPKKYVGREIAFNISPIFGEMGDKDKYYDKDEWKNWFGFFELTYSRISLEVDIQYFSALSNAMCHGFVKFAEVRTDIPKRGSCRVLSTRYEKFINENEY